MALTAIPGVKCTPELLCQPIIKGNVREAQILYALMYYMKLSFHDKQQDIFLNLRVFQTVYAFNLIKLLRLWSQFKVKFEIKNDLIYFLNTCY